MMDEAQEVDAAGAGKTRPRVTGIGGIFFKARDPEALRNWYARHLGIAVQEWGGAVFMWGVPEEAEIGGAASVPGMPALGTGSTTWSISPTDTEYFQPSAAPFMVNYRVPDVRSLLALLREEGCQVLDALEESEFGIFGWVMDPEGNKVELWEPPAGM